MSSQIWTVFSGILVLCLVCAVAYLWQTVRQQEILLTSLDTAFRSGRVDALPQRVQALEEKQQQYLPLTQAQDWRGEDGKAREALPGTIVIRQRKQIPVNFIRLHKIMTLCYCNPELSVKTAPDSFLVV
ncbi:hypothetical protein ACQSDJ_17110 [Salmonella enterica]|uniref:hypothetical protein n=1 Tax=Salmonella enterica TaxID=28901 RepID=UPI003D3119A3